MAKADNKYGVYTIKQANTIQGKPDKRQSKVTRERCLMAHDYAEKINADYDRTGKYAELDKDATKAYLDAPKGNTSDKKITKKKGK